MVTADEDTGIEVAGGCLLLLALFLAVCGLVLTALLMGRWLVGVAASW